MVKFLCSRPPVSGVDASAADNVALRQASAHGRLVIVPACAPFERSARYTQVPGTMLL